MLFIYKIWNLIVIDKANFKITISIFQFQKRSVFLINFYPYLSVLLDYPKNFILVDDKG